MKVAKEVKMMILEELLWHLTFAKTCDIDGITRFMLEQDDDTYIPYMIGRLVEVRRK